MQSCKLFGTSRLAGGFLFIQKGPLLEQRAKGEKMMQVHQNVGDSMPATGPAVKGKV